MSNAPTFDHDGRQLPVWTFATWPELEDFLDTLCPVDYVATCNNPALDRLGLHGVFHSQAPGPDVQTDNTFAIAVYRVTHPNT